MSVMTVHQYADWHMARMPSRPYHPGHDWRVARMLSRPYHPGHDCRVAHIPSRPFHPGFDCFSVSNALVIFLTVTVMLMVKLYE